MLLNALIVADPGAAWRCEVSGADSGSQTHMRDAYAFLWKQQPVNSNCAHAESPNQIDAMSEAVILRQVPKDNFPGRRPGMLTMNVRAGATVVPLNIVSFHAQTPVNKFSKDDDGALIVMNHGTHLAFYADPNAADVQDKARAFLAANSVSSTEA
jgi:hypothetical protein